MHAHPAPDAGHDRGASGAGDEDGAPAVDQERGGGLGAAPAASLIRALRPRQWSKNLVLFAGFLFTLNEKWRPGDGTMGPFLAQAFCAFASFCLLSSAVYLMNDLKDIEQDRRHPEKRHRPLASGALSPGLAAAVAAALAAAALGAGYLLRPAFAAVGLAYLAMQVAYTLALKQVVLLDVFVIALGFVLRAVGGAVAIGAEISPWLYIVTLLGALFLGFAKRRHELLLLSEVAGHHRPILEEYSAPLLDQIITIMAAATIMAYSLYTFTSPKLPRNHLMMLTIPLVIFGMCRYLYLIHRHEAGGKPEEILLRDRPIIATVVLWTGASALILALGR